MALNDRDESDLQELIGLFANADDDATRKQMLTYMKGINQDHGIHEIGESGDHNATVHVQNSACASRDVEGWTYRRRNADFW